jgi:hypothetical protein
MLARYNPGDILRVMFSGRVDGQAKARPVLYWLQDSADPQRILVSGIFGTPSDRSWEQKLFPSTQNGLTKECVIRIDDTRYIRIDNVLSVLGSLNKFEFEVVRNLMIRYSDNCKASSPDDFGNEIFDVFK